MLLLSLTLPAACAGEGSALSPTFTLDTVLRPTYFGGTGTGNSSIFSLDTRPYLGPFLGDASANSDLFKLDTRSSGGTLDGPVVIYPTLAYNEATRTLSLAARVNDPLYGRITAGTLNWSVDSASGASLRSGTASYQAAAGQWLASTILPAGLGSGKYAVLLSVRTDRGRQGAASLILTLGTTFAAISGTVTHQDSQAALAGAQVALFEAGGVNGLWTLVTSEYGGNVPPLATLLARLSPAFPVLTTGADGVYAWNNVPAGAAFVIVVSANGYRQQYANTAYVEASGTSITRHFRLSPEAETLASIASEVADLQDAAEGVLDYNAGRMAALCQAAMDDNLLGEPDLLSWWSDVGGYVSLLNPGANLGSLGQALVGASLETAVKSVLAQALVRSLQGRIEDQIEDFHRRFSNDLIQKRFPVTRAEFIASEYHLRHMSALRQIGMDFRTSSSSTVPANGFDFGKARQLMEQNATIFRQAAEGRSVFLAHARPADQVGVFKLETMISQYHKIAAIEHAAGIGEAVLSSVQVVGTAVTWLCVAGSFTGATVPVGAISATAAEVAGLGKLAVSHARISLKRQMAFVFIGSFGTYCEDNGIALTAFDSTTELLLNEATSPVYLNSGNTFSASTSVDLNLLHAFGYDYMFTWGLPKLDVAKGIADVTVENTGNAPSDFRIVGYTIWSPVTIKKILGLDPESILTYSAWAGANGVPPGTGFEVPINFQGYSRNFLSQLMPHYLTVETYSGPWRTGTEYKPFFVLAPGTILRPISWNLASLQPVPSEVIAPVADKTGQLRLSEIRSKIKNAVPLIVEPLSVMTPSRNAIFAIETNVHAVDIQLFAPVEAEVALLVADSQGRRLGFSSENGLTHNEITGFVTDMTRRPISLRLLEPPLGETFTVTVTLLAPGPEPVAIGLYQESEPYADALLVAHPARVVLDCAEDIEPAVDLMVSEGSMQNPLTNLTATLSNLARLDGTGQLALGTNSLQTVRDLGAGESALITWPIILPENAERGKYVSTVRLTSAQTADLSLPVVALVRKASNVVSLLEGTNVDDGVLQTKVFIDTNGIGETWVHVPKGFYVLHAQLGLAPASTNLLSPAIDIGSDGSPEMMFTGHFDSGVVLDDFETAINQYLVAHHSPSNSTVVPIRITGNPGESVQIGGLQLYLEALPNEWHRIAIQPDGTARLDLQVQPGWRYTVEASMNLIDWEFLDTITATNSIMPFIDMSATGARMKFYRAVVQ